MFSNHLAQIPMGEVRTLVCVDIVAALSRLEAVELTGWIDRKFVVHTWDKLPDHESILEDILQALAKVTLAIWPSWYGQAETFHSSREPVLEDALLNQFKLQELQATRQDVCVPWLKAAVGACQAGNVPVLHRFSRAIQVSQLGLAIAPHNLVIVLAMGDRHPQNHRLLSLARAATWLAKETKARVAVLIPDHLANQQELDSILYGAIAISPSTQQTADRPTSEESRHTIWPIQGNPHPFSPGEQILARRLSHDAELAPLFCFNQNVETLRGSRYLVDLLWSEGKVVVEVDGYRHHGNAFAFGADRHRDYELLISGYSVLRMPHDEVVNDVEIAVEKIRDVVRFRRSQHSKSEAQ
ncbi:MAG: DUF559 domain-containing protein [Leptolyngbyaceae cyanobacterium RU_5_1]|nr:DUF559 domain-containing protein [Leptolyngbyaceae cyanobacterium RU_5_1]